MLKLCLGYVGNRFIGCFEYTFKTYCRLWEGDEFTIPLSNALLGDMIKYILVTGLPFYAVIFAVAFISQIAQIKWKVSLSR